ncbi:MAG: hypothetical protein WBK51_14180 [Polaromonas sp.]
MYSIDPGATTLATTSIGIIPAPPAPAAAGNILGATTDAAGRLFVYATSTGTTTIPTYVTVAEVNTGTAAITTAWTQLRTTSGATPTLAGSGDSFVDQAGSNWIITNTNPPRLFTLNLNPGASFGQVNSPGLALTGANGMAVGAVSTDPLSGLTYMGGLNSTVSGTLSAPYASVTFGVNLGTGASTILPQTDTSFFISDMGNCAFAPAPPTVSKSFTPTSRAVSPGTSTLLITLGNTNLAPAYLNTAFNDVLPAGLVVAATPLLQGSCVTYPGNTVTATAGSGTVTLASGGRVPAGGCTMSLVVSAAANGAYVNTIPAGRLNTSAGSNALQAQATFQVAVNDFSLSKQQRTGANAFSTSALSVPGGTTAQYALVIVNGAGSAAAGTVTFVDTLPPLMTPVLSVTTNASGGVCRTATAVVTGRTRVTGTFTNAPIGGTCTVTITARASVTSVLSTFPNTATIGPVAPTIDASSANNSATVTTSIPPSTTLTLAKDDGKLTTTAGSTNTYVIRAVNRGPAPANGAIVRDPAVAGLSCTNLTCIGTGGAVCAPTPALASFQISGVPITTFPANSTATFTLTCGVTATGQ